MTRKNRNLLDEVWFKWKRKCNMSNFQKIFVNVLLYIDLVLKFSARKHKAASTLKYDCLLKKNYKVWNCLFFFLQVRVVGLAEPGSPTIMHRSMELRALEQQRFRWMLKKLLCFCEHNTGCAQRYGVLWVSWNDKFCYLYRSSRSFNISPGHFDFFHLFSVQICPSPSQKVVQKPHHRSMIKLVPRCWRRDVVK